MRSGQSISETQVAARFGGLSARPGSMPLPLGRATHMQKPRRSHDGAPSLLFPISRLGSRPETLCQSPKRPRRLVRLSGCSPFQPVDRCAVVVSARYPHSVLKIHADYTAHLVNSNPVAPVHPVSEDASTWH